MDSRDLNVFPLNTIVPYAPLTRIFETLTPNFMSMMAFDPKKCNQPRRIASTLLMLTGMIFDPCMAKEKIGHLHCRLLQA